MKFMTIAQIILFHRKKASLSRNDLAMLANVGKTVIFDMEHGKDTVQFASLLKILTVLNIQLDFKSPFMETFFQTQNSTE